ncbi:MAG: DUF6504 family protein [Pseudomonadota bacterium]|nr:DUF6504 family protein [Pseudomonadota bacterium]
MSPLEAGRRRRILSLWLPSFATDCLTWRRRGGATEPLATTVEMHGRPVLLGLSQGARDAGLSPLMAVSDARARLPELRLYPSDPLAETAARDHLIAFCRRYTPWVAADPAVLTAVEGGLADVGLWLDITGCAHLCGGEAQLLDDLLGRLAGLGLSGQACIADSAGAAWAVARFAPHLLAAGGHVIDPGTQAGTLASLPTAALRLPAKTVEGLALSGLRRIGQLYDLPRAPLVARFGKTLGQHLDQALGRADEPITPAQVVAPYRVRLTLPEPIALVSDVTAACQRLLARLVERLAADHKGVRQLRLLCFGVDGAARQASIGVSRPRRDAAGLLALLQPHFETLDAGFGFDMLILEAVAVDELGAAPRLLDLAGATPPATAAVDDLVDRLTNRLGAGAVHRLAPVARHLPERAEEAVTPATAAAWDDPATSPPATTGARPLRLFDPPEGVETTALLPDHPPARFRWRGVTYEVVRALGPERLAPEWWRTVDGKAARTRDYFQVEDADGRRFWLYRLGLAERGEAPAWYLHGVFA